MSDLTLQEALNIALQFPHPTDKGKTLPAYYLSMQLGLSPSVVNKILLGQIRTIRQSSAMLLYKKYGIQIDPAYITGDDRATVTEEDHKLPGS
jgi:hypothetical protein